MATRARQHSSEQTKARALRIAGILIILLGAGAALLARRQDDLVGHDRRSADRRRPDRNDRRVAAAQVRTFAMAAGIVTALAGLLFVSTPRPISSRACGRSSAGC